MKAFSEVCSNPAAMDKYKNNPKVMKVIEKMKNRFGGGGGGAMPGKSTIPTDLDLNNVSVNRFVVSIGNQIFEQRISL